MATAYFTRAYGAGPFYFRGYNELGCSERAVGNAAAITRSYANGDTVGIVRLGFGDKIVAARFSNDQLDSNNSPLLAGVLEVVDPDGSTVTLVTLTTALLGAAAGSITPMTNPAALGYVIKSKSPSSAAYVQFRVTAAPATVAAGSIAAFVGVTSTLYGKEDMTVPT